MAAKTLPLPRPGERLLFIRFSSLGDVLLSMRQAKALKDRFPFLEITWMAHSEYEPILGMQPYVDDVLPWDIRRGRGTIISAIGKVRRSGFRWLYSVHRNDRSALVSAFSGIPFRIGGHKNLQFLYDFSLEEVKKEWGIKPVPEEEKLLFVPEEKKFEILNMLGGKERPVLLCAIGASKRFKRWPAWNWSVFLDEAVSLGLQPVLLGSGREEGDLAGEILLSCSCSHEIVDMVDKLTLDQVCSLAAVSVMAVGGDTGPVHMARLLGIPCIGLFTVRDPARYGHRGGNLVPIICDSPFVSYPEEPPLFQPLGTIKPSRVILELQNILSK